jgi:hypothetical protein
VVSLSADSWVDSKFNEDDLKTHGAIFLQKNCITRFIAICNPWPLTTGWILYITNFEKASPLNIKKH